MICFSDESNHFLLLLLESFTYVNSSIEQYNGEQVVVDAWFIRMDDKTMYHTYARDKCIPLGSTTTTDSGGKRDHSRIFLKDSFYSSNNDFINYN